MAEKFSQEAEDDELSEKRASQQRLLLLLLLLILLFGYLYFFTGLIRPRPEAPQPQPATQAQIVKKPLPPRVAQNEEAPAEKSAAAKGGKGATVAPEQKPEAAAKAAQGGKPAQAAKPAPPTPSAKPAKNLPPVHAGKHEPPDQGVQVSPAAKPAPKEAKPVIEKKPAGKAVAQPKGAEKPGAANKTAAAGKKAAGETAAAAGKKGAAEKTAAAAKPGAAGKTAAAARKGAAAKGGAESAAAENAGSARAPKVATKPAAGRYAVEIDRDLAESEMAPVLAKLKRAGISRIVKSKAQKGEQVHRLFLADFGNHEEAQEELERLKLAAPGAFMLKENGRYAVYAGSYLREGKAAVEQDRLYEKGVKLLLKSAKAPVPVVRLRAGSFPDQASAERSASRLTKEGVPAKVVRLGK